jgi:hypothetical protein
MRLLFLCLLWLQDSPPAIEFPETSKPTPQVDDTPKPAPVDEFKLDELYLIQSDVSLHLIPSPPGVVQVTSAKSGSVIFSRFAGGQGLEERQVERQHGYVVRGLAAGSVELIVLPTGSQDLSEMRRRVLTVIAGADPIQPAPVIPTDEVGLAFREYERLWRAAQVDLADRLERGEITSEELAANWFAAANQSARKTAFTPLLVKESAEFGGELWSPQKQAAWIRRYSNAGK